MFSIYAVYSLPSDLALTSGYQAVFAKVYLVLAVTFLIGAIAIWNALQNRSEVVVFRERKVENVSETTEARDSKQMSINLDIVRNALKESTDLKATQQAPLQSICKQLEAGEAVLYTTTNDDKVRKLELTTGYALNF